MTRCMMLIFFLSLFLQGCPAPGEPGSGNTSQQGQGQGQGQQGQGQGQQGQGQGQQTFKKAMTWSQIKQDKQLGIVLVGLSGGDPYGGDTPVDQVLPVLAIKKEYLPRPNYRVDGTGGAMDKEYYRGWSGGHIKLTPPVKGSALTSLKAANDYCSKTCGQGWQMAEFHDGLCYPGMDLGTFHGATWPGRDKLRRGGWNFWAYGDVGTNTRFWVSIDDQNANPWGR